MLRVLESGIDVMSEFNGHLSLPLIAYGLRIADQTARAPNCGLIEDCGQNEGSGLGTNLSQACPRSELLTQSEVRTTVLVRTPQSLFVRTLNPSTRLAVLLSPLKFSFVI